MSAENGAPAELLTETCNFCGGTGLVTDPQILGRFEPGNPVGIKQRRCVVCNGTGQIRLNERMFDGSRTSHGMQKQIDNLLFKDELNSNGIRVLQNSIAELKAENKRLRNMVGKAWDDGLVKGFERCLHPENDKCKKQFLLDNVGLCEG